MRIALIRRTYITHIDGVNRAIALLTDALIKLGHDATILSWSYYGVRKAELPQWFKKLHGMDVEPTIETLRDSVMSGSWLRIALDWWFKGSKIMRDFDMAIINGIVPLRFKPIIAVNHGVIPGASWLYRKIATRLYNRADKVVCVSRKTAEEMKELGIRCDVVIPPPLKLDLYRPSSEREDIIVHIGGRPVKNPEISARTAEILNERGLRVKLYVIGRSGRDTEHVKWLGAVDERARIGILCRAKALVHPSSYEAFSLAVAEAMACGAPPVVSPAVPEELVVDRENGLRVNSYDPVDYADALQALLTDEELWTRLSQNGVKTAEGLDHIKIAERYVDLLKNLG
jgi:glycosyltransferase involved in cell wall biosynthesis